MQTYEVTRTRAGHTVDYYKVCAHSGLDAIERSRRVDLDDSELVIHAFAQGEGADRTRDATRVHGRFILG